MVTSVSDSWSALSWKARRPWVRRRLLHALQAQQDRHWLSTWELARQAGLPGIPAGEVHAAVTELVNGGFAEGLRGPRGWSRVRASLREGQWRALDEAITQRARQPDGWLRRAAEDAVTTAIVVAPGSAPNTAPVAIRDFSVASRLPVRRTNRLISGFLLFVVALLVAGVVAGYLFERWTSEGQPGPLTRAGWYDKSARSYADGYFAGSPGFTLPYRFTDVTGTPATAPRPQIERALRQYVQAALFLGYPSHGGILAWARTEFGELPAGDAGGAWKKRVADTYVARSLAGTAGYELTPGLLAAANLPAGQRDPVVLSAGLVRAIDASLFLGTPQPGGVLDWARRTFGDLPPE